MTKYKSPGSGATISFAQYLAELLVERQARFKGTILPSRYWKNPDYIIWTKELKNQVFGVRKLNKIYSEEVIFRAFLQNEWVYSSHSPKFQDLVREENRNYKNIESIRIDIIEETNKVPVKFGTQSRKSKLE